MKTTAHTRYELADGTRVPGVTTIIGLLNKPQLVAWANQLGLQGIDSTKYRDEKGLIGSLAHEYISAALTGAEVDTSDYSQKQIEYALACRDRWWEWEMAHVVKAIQIEQPLTSQLHRYGGTPDLYGMIKDEPVLFDWKTGYLGVEAIIQCAAYDQLLCENGLDRIERAVIVGIPREETEALREVWLTREHLDIAFDMFLCLRVGYDILPELKKMLR